MAKQKLAPALGWFAALCCLAFVAYAVYFNVLGSNAAAIAAFFGVGDPQVGLVTTLQAVGILAVTVFAAMWGDRFNKIHMVWLGLGVMGVAALLIGLIPSYAPQGGFSLMLLFSLAAGVGFTLIDVMVNSSVADVFAERRNTVLPLVHGFFGLGSMFAPLLVTAVASPANPASFATSYLIVGIMAVAVLVVFIAAGKRIIRHTPYAELAKNHATDEIAARDKDSGQPIAGAGQHSGKPWEIFTQKESWILLAACVTYFAFQIGMSTWLPSYCEVERGMAFGWSGNMVTVFFAGALAMRFLSPLFLKKWKAKQCYVVFGLLAVACAVAAVFVPGDAAFIALIAVCGFLQGAQSMMLVLMCCAAFPKRTASASSLITLAIGVAMLVFPYIMALMAQQTGFGNSILMICGALAASSLIILWLGKKRELA